MYSSTFIFALAVIAIATALPSAGNIGVGGLLGETDGNIGDVLDVANGLGNIIGDSEGCICGIIENLLGGDQNATKGLLKVLDLNLNKLQDDLLGNSSALVGLLTNFIGKIPEEVLPEVKSLLAKANEIEIDELISKLNELVPQVKIGVSYLPIRTERA